MGIWECFQTVGLIPETHGFTNYSTGDEGLIALKTITKSCILNELIVDEDGEEEKEGDKDDEVFL